MKAPFNPSALGHSESIGGDYTEGNAWQYTWHVQHDVPGLIQLFGGEEPFLNKLDSLFTVKLEGESLSDVTGLIGQYAHGNEPSHHVTYLYALAGRPNVHKNWFVKYSILNTRTNLMDFVETMIADRCLPGICLVRWDSIR